MLLSKPTNVQNAEIVPLSLFFFFLLWFNYNNLNLSAFVLETQVTAAALGLISLANKITVASFVCNFWQVAFIPQQ